MKNRKSNQGFSLVEMAIGVVLVGGIMLVFSNVTSYVQKSSAQSTHYSEAQQNARIALDFITAAVRKAGAGVESARGQLGIVHAGPFQIAVNGDLDGGQSHNGKPALSALYQGRAGGSVAGVYTPTTTYESGAETVVITLDSNDNGLISRDDRGDDADEDIPNEHLYLVKRKIYGFDGKNNEVRDANLALIRGPVAYKDGTRSPVLFEYVYDHDHADSTRDRLWGDSNLDGSLNDSEIAAMKAMPDSLLFFIRKIKVNVVSESIKPNDRVKANDGFAQVSMSSQVFVRNADRIEKSRIFGTVFYDADEDGEFDDNEPGIPGVPILVDSGRRRAMTDAFGDYSIPVEAGTYKVEQVDLAGYSSSTPNILQVKLLPGEMQTADFGDHTDASYGFIEGTVFEDLNENGQKGGGEDGIQGVLITLDNGMTAQTDEDGEYTFTIPVGNYEVEETDLEDYGSTTPNLVSVSIAKQGEKVKADFGDKMGDIFGKIEGYVYLDANENGSRDFGEEGLEDAVVSLSEADAVLTDSHGYYALEVAPGTYTVSETDPEGYTSVSPNEVADVVVGADSVVTIDFGDIVQQGLDFHEKVVGNIDPPFSLATNDFKEDSFEDADIVIGMTSGSTSKLAVYNNAWQGAGTPLHDLFQDMPSYTRDAASEVTTVLALDFTGDGRTDLITGHDYSAGNNVQLWSNSGSGDLNSSPSAAYTSGVSTLVTSMKAADLNGDSALDLVVGQSSSYGTFSGAVEIFLGFTGGGLSPDAQFDYGDQGQMIGDVAAVEIGDVDGDGDLDIIVGSNDGDYSGNIDVFKNSKGSYSWAARYVAGARINDLKLVDSAGLGVLDLVVAVSTGEFSGGIQLWYNYGNDFGVADAISGQYEADAYLYGSGEALTLETAFLDDDIFPEIVVGTRGPAEYMGEILVVYHRNEDIIGIANIKESLQGEVVKLAVADFDKDGHVDVVAATRTSASQGRLGIYYANTGVTP